MKGLKQKLYNHIKENKHVTYGDMCLFIAKEGYKVSYGERVLRLLHEEGKIENQFETSKRNVPYIYAYYIGTPVVSKPKQTVEFLPDNTVRIHNN